VVDCAGKFDADGTGHCGSDSTIVILQDVTLLCSFTKDLFALLTGVG